MTFLVTGLVWQFLSFPKITILSAFTVIVSGAKFCHGSTFVWLSANTTFWKIYHHLRIIVNFFSLFDKRCLNLPLKVLVFFMLLNNWQGDLFPPHSSHLSSSLISERAALSKCDFRFYGKPIIGTSGNTFLSSSSHSRITSNSFSSLFRYLNTG